MSCEASVGRICMTEYCRKESYPRKEVQIYSEGFSVCQTIIITSQRVTKCILMTFFFLSFLDSALSIILRNDKNYSLQIVSN